MVSLSDLALWTVIATWVLAIGTLLLMYWQTRLAQRLNSANAVMTLRDRYDSPRLRAARRHLSEMLVAGRVDDITNYEVPNFFELVGAQAAREILDLEMVWEAFGGWVTAYYHALTHPTDIIGRMRTRLQDPLVYAKFEWLYAQVVAMDRERLGTAYDASLRAGEEQQTFLRNETRLLPTDE